MLKVIVDDHDFRQGSQPEACATLLADMLPWTNTTTVSMLRTVVLLLCVILGFYTLYYFPIEYLGSRYLWVVLVGLLLYPIGTLIAFAGSDRSNRVLGLSGLGLMVSSMLLLAWAQWEFLFLAFVAPFAALLRVCWSLPRTLIIALSVHLLLAGVSYLHWQLNGVFLQSPLYLLFTLSTVVLIHLMIAEGEARARLAALHERLQATQQLLTSNAIDKERLRISRDLHDSLGHHLSALSVQLELASHHAEGRAGSPIAKAMAITKSLLSEVRDVVGSLRAESEIGLRKSLEHMVAGSPGRIGLDIEDGFSVSRPDVEEAIFRAVQEILTNYARHSGTASLSIWLHETADEWVVESSDSGDRPVQVTPSSGLLGMKERIEALGGALLLETDSGVRHLIRIPKEAPA